MISIPFTTPSYQFRKALKSYTVALMGMFMTNYWKCDELSTW